MTTLDGKYQVIGAWRRTYRYDGATHGCRMTTDRITPSPRDRLCLTAAATRAERDNPTWAFFGGQVRIADRWYQLAPVAR